jgi:FtsP/CotA-like multicopper oxidase with cupredoxin domain
MISRRQFMVVGALGVAGASVACSQSQSPSGSSPDLTLAAGETDVDLAGATLHTWAYGNQVPAQEIRLHKGDRFRARLTNALPQGVTVHWHGLAIVNDMDGVPVLTQDAVPNGQTFSYDFVVPDAGTYWFHSHVGTQLDRGLYGPLIIEDPDEKADYDGELVVVLDDWIDGTGTNPDQVLEKLRKTGMKPMEPGGPGVTPATPLGKDGGDVEYPYFIINGRAPADPQVVDYRMGQRVRLRVINAGSDTAFRVAVPNTSMRVIQTDGYPVVPVETDSVILGMGERVDAIITLNESLPVVAVPEGKQGHARLNMRVTHGSAAANIDEFVASVRTQVPLNTATLSPTPEVTLPAKKPDQIIDARLAGPVNGYSWPINGKLYNPPRDGVAVQPNQRVRIRYLNDTNMFHPFHLHGHTFQVMNGDIAKARKDTVLVPPKQTVEIDFDTDNPGRWITHCHNTYHLEAGMATFIEYAD